MAGEFALQSLGTSITDLNEMKTTGQFSGHKWINGPVGEIQIGILLVGTYSPDWICQIFISVSVAPQVYLRGYQVSKWGPWKSCSMI